jgi:hypothetical protein
MKKEEKALTILSIDKYGAETDLILKEMTEILTNVRESIRNSFVNYIHTLCSFADIKSKLTFMMDKSGENYDEHSPMMSKKFNLFLNLDKVEDEKREEAKCRSEDYINTVYLRSKTPNKVNPMGSFGNTTLPDNPENLPNFNKRGSTAHKASNSCLFNDEDLLSSLKLSPEVVDVTIKNEQLNNARRRILNNFYKNSTPKRDRNLTTNAYADDD